YPGAVFQDVLDNYVKKIPNTRKREFAAKYLNWRAQGGEGTPPYDNSLSPKETATIKNAIHGKLQSSPVDGEPIDTEATQAQITGEGEQPSGHPGQDTADVAHGQRAGEDAGTLPERQDTGDRGPVGQGHPAGGPLHQGAGETGNVGTGGGGPGGGADTRPSGSAGGGVSPSGSKQGGAPSPEVAPNYSLPKDKDWIPTGLKSRVSANIEAVKTLNDLEKSGRAPTPEEQSALSKYVGWGGLKPVFDSGKAAYRDNPPKYDFQREEWQNWEKAWGKQYDEV